MINKQTHFCLPNSYKGQVEVSLELNFDIVFLIKTMFSIKIIFQL